MKNRILLLSLALMLSFSLSVGAYASVTYVADNITYQNLNGQQLGIKTYTLLPDQNPADLVEPDYDFDGFHYVYSGMTKETLEFSEEKTHKETVTITTSSKDLSAILEALEPTIEYSGDDGEGVLALDHTSIKTEAAGYKDISYTVTATKSYSGLDRNDSSYIEKAITKDGRTLSLSDVSWAVESTALVDDALVPMTFCAVATYSGKAYSRSATGYVTTATYTGTISKSGVSGIRYIVTYLGTAIEPEPEETVTKSPQTNLIPIICGALAIGVAGTALFFCTVLRTNTTVYRATGNDNEYEKCGSVLLNEKNPEIRVDKLKPVPSGVIAIEVEEKTARKLEGRTILIRCRDQSYKHTVGSVNGPYWFKVNLNENEEEKTT